MITCRARSVVSLLAVAVLAAPAAARAQDALTLVREGRKLERASRFDESLALYEKAAAADPALFDAQFALGRALDLAGRYDEARDHLQQALGLAEEGAREMVQSAIGVSYAFQGNARDAAPWYREQFDAQIARGRMAMAAETANALARVDLEAGDLDAAAEWYKKGYDTGLKTPDLTPAGRNLWDFRWENAQGRIAARRGRFDEARAHARKARAILDRGGNDDQRPFVPYLTGYIALYAGRYRQAIDDLLKGDLGDPFVAGLVAEAYAKLGDRANARKYYARVMASNAHSINAAFSRPRARAYLADGSGL
jgi:tetratricopeptide (TPR) repeat protein